MEQYEVNDLYQLALDVQLQDHKVGRVLAAFVKHLAATEGLEPDQLKEAPVEEQTPATSPDMDIAPLGEDHSQVPTSEVPYPSRESPRDFSGEPIDRLEQDQERAISEADQEQTEHRRGRRKKALAEGDEVKLDEPDEQPTDVGMQGPVEGE